MAALSRVRVKLVCNLDLRLAAPHLFADFTNRVEDMRLQDLAEGDSKELVSQVHLLGLVSIWPHTCAWCGHSKHMKEQITFLIILMFSCGLCHKLSSFHNEHGKHKILCVSANRQ